MMPSVTWNELTNSARKKIKKEQRAGRTFFLAHRHGRGFQIAAYNEPPNIEILGACFRCEWKVATVPEDSRP